MPKSGENTRNAILDAANRIVRERGVERLTLDETAHEAGISKGGLLYHFPSKEALIKGMIQYYLDQFTADLNVAARQEGEEKPGRWTRAYLHTTYADSQRNPPMSSGLLAAVATNPQLLAPMQQTFREWIRLLEKDGIDPTIATIIRLAVDGLWMVDLFGFAPPEAAEREKVLRVLESLAGVRSSDLVSPGRKHSGEQAPG